MNDKLKLDNYERPKLQMPDEGTDLLLHSCCAPVLVKLWKRWLHQI